MAIILATKYVSFTSTSGSSEVIQHPNLILHAGYTIFAAGLIVGLGNLACGPSVGIIGSACVIVDAQNPQNFIKIFVIEIFASALGIFALIVGILVMSSANFKP